jgi:curved DNA-binding protein CbpA
MTSSSTLPTATAATSVPARKYGLYADLGLTEAAADSQSGAEIRSCITSQEIRKAYLAAAKLEHPDKFKPASDAAGTGPSTITSEGGGSAGAGITATDAGPPHQTQVPQVATDRFQRLHQAYEVLFNENKRLVYNRTGWTSAQQLAQQTAAPNTSDTLPSKRSTPFVSSATFAFPGVNRFFAQFVEQSFHHHCAQQQLHQQQQHHRQQQTFHPFMFAPPGAAAQHQQHPQASQSSAGTRVPLSARAGTVGGAAAAVAATAATVRGPTMIRKMVEVDMESMLLPCFQRKYEITEQLVCTLCQQTAHRTPLACGKCKGKGTVTNTLSRTFEFGRHLDFRVPLIVPNVFSDAKSFEFQFVVKPHVFYTYPLSSSQVEITHPGHLILHWRLAISDWVKCMRSKSRLLLSVPNLDTSGSRSNSNGSGVEQSSVFSCTAPADSTIDASADMSNESSCSSDSSPAAVPVERKDARAEDKMLALVIEDCSKIQPHQIWQAQGLGLWNIKARERGVLFVMLDIDMSPNASSWPHVALEPKTGASSSTVRLRAALTLSDSATADQVKWYNHILWMDGNAPGGITASSDQSKMS